MNSGPVKGRIGLTIHADDLLARRMGHAGQNAGLGNRTAALDAANSGDRDMFLAKGVQQCASRFIIADDSHGQNIHSQIRQVIDGIARSSRHNRPVAMAQNEHRSLTRDAGYFAVDKFVRDQVAQNGDAELGKLVNDFDQPVRWFGILLHRRNKLSHAVAKSGIGSVLLRCAAVYLSRFPQRAIPDQAWQSGKSPTAAETVSG